MVGTLPTSVHHHGIKAHGAPFAAQRYRCSLFCRASFLSRIAVPPPSQNSNFSPIPQLLLVKQQKSVFAHDSKPSHYLCYSCSRAPPLLSLLTTLTSTRRRRRRNYSSGKDDCDGCSHQLKSPQNEIFQTFWRRRKTINNYRQTIASAVRKMMICKVTGDSESDRDLKSDVVSESETNMEEEREEEEESGSVLTQVALWILAAVYTSWLFLLPYAPGDPVWAISRTTISEILNLSINFFFVLPLANMVGFDLLHAPVTHPAYEALFNFVLGWALLFAPLLFTDRKRNRFTLSLDALWIISMFLTNTLLIPYMAIRSYQRPHRDLLVEASTNATANTSGTNVQMSGLQRFMVSGAQQIAFTGAVVGIVSVIWFVIGRLDGGYGDFAERWDYFLGYIGSDRPTYAFIWDLCCYTIFQPWLIRDNYQNVRRDRLETVKALHLVPYVGLVAYCWGLESIEGLGKVKKNA
ncbi:hypothetical protein CY35_18G051400 [Sphagnum magellanicum]|nr:hypothetical protein CY35_18G051400 [Sphagnum magellanicum]